MRSLSLSLFALFSLAQNVEAQNLNLDWFPHPVSWWSATPNCSLNCPPLWPLTPGANFSIPGSSRAQLLVPVADLPTTPSLLRDLGFVPLLIHEQFGIYHYDRLIVRMAQQPASTLATTFSANLVVNPQTVLDRTDHYWTPNGHNDIDLAVAAIGLDTAFFFDPSLGNLVIDLEVHGGVQTLGTGFYGFARSTTQTVAAYGWTGTSPLTGTMQTAGHAVIVMRDKATFEEMGRPCPTSQGSMPFLYDSTFGEPALGASQRFDLVGGLPNGLAAFVGGMSLDSLKLDSLGAPNCVLHPSPDASISLLLDGLGETTQTFNIPSGTAFLGINLFFQIAILDPAANSLGIATSSYVRLQTGSS